MATRKTRTFSDINLLFTASPTTGDITKKLDEEAIKASVKNLIMTRNYERPFHPEIGCQVHSLLFENFTPITKRVMQSSIAKVIAKFEPRVTLLEVRVKEEVDNNEIWLDIYFRINNTPITTTLTVALYRAR